MEFTAIVSETGRVTLPAKFRKELGMPAGERHEIVLRVHNGKGTIQSRRQQWEALRGKFAQYRTGGQTAAEAIRDMRDEDLRDEDRGFVVKT